MVSRLELGENVACTCFGRPTHRSETAMTRKIDKQADSLQEGDRLARPVLLVPGCAKGGKSYLLYNSSPRDRDLNRRSRGEAD